MPLLGKAEKGELEELILKELQAHFDEHGPQALLVDGVRLIVTSRGPAVDRGEHPDPLAAVSPRGLFTGLCYLSTDSPAMPRDALEALASEATAAAATQINRLAAD